MGTMRKLVREKARAQSRKKCGTTSMFHYYFDKMWKEDKEEKGGKHTGEQPQAGREQSTRNGK